MGAFSYDDDGVRSALADCPLSGSQTWDLVTDDARTQSDHGREATGGDTNTGGETWRETMGSQVLEGATSSQIL